MRLTRGNESIRCETVCSKIVYSVRIGPPQPFNSLIHQGLPTRGNPFFFRFGRIWAQNFTQPLRKLQIIFTRNVRIESHGQRRITVTNALHPDLKRHSKAIHDRNVSVPEGVQATAINPK